MKSMKAAWYATGLLFCVGAAVKEFWVESATGGTASLRGLSAVDARTVWASGSGGTILRTGNGGETWSRAAVFDAKTLDFRAIAAFDLNYAVALSAGPGGASRVYRTMDGGAHWGLALQNTAESGFFDALAFWDRQRGLLLGDPVDGRFVVLQTEDGGASWKPVPAAGMPVARPVEGAFAASGSCLTTGSGGHAWFGTGGTSGARVFRSEDWGRTWSVAQTPLLHDSASTGIFSLAFRDARHGVAVGGDYQNPAGHAGNAAVTEDGGATWRTLDGRNPGGFRSAAAFIPGSNTVVATGPQGTDISADGGSTWQRVSAKGYHALSFAHDGSGWASGSDGRIGRMK